MAERETGPDLAEDGPDAPPRANGELVFESPWESRLFGITLALHRQGLFEWDDFRQLLIREIGRWEAEHADQPDAPYRYYERWHAALEQLVAERRFCDGAQLDERALQFAARPHGHDHEH